MLSDFYKVMYTYFAPMVNKRKYPEFGKRRGKIKRRPESKKVKHNKYLNRKL